MIFSTPLPFDEAVKARRIKTLLPTEFLTKDLARVEPALLERSVISAGQTSAELLQRVSDGVDSMLDGKLDRASARASLKEILGSLGAKVDESDLQDIRSDARLNLIVDMNIQQAQGYGHKMQGLHPAVLDQWPAQEFIRVQDAEEPRPWKDKWLAAGGRFPDDRMIALKDDPIWRKINAFGRDYAPFDFNSGMDLVDVDRDTAVDAGLIEKDEEAGVPESDDFNAELETTPEVRAGWLRDALNENLKGVGKVGTDGVLRHTGGKS